MIKKIKGLTFEKLFFAITFVLACFTTNSDRLPSYLSDKGTVMIFTKYILIFIFVAFATIINKDSSKFISKYAPTVTVIITAILIFDYYVTQLSGSQFLFRVWWIGAIFVAEASLFITATALKIKNYKRFFEYFWIGFTPIYLFLFFLCFIRTPFADNMTTNFTIGKGTFLMLKALLNNINVSFEAPLIFFGNLFVFIPIPFILYSVFKIKKDYIIAIFGTLIPFIIEGYQYFFKCGNVDIDDIILNIGGFLIGFLIYILIKKKHLAK